MEEVKSDAIREPKPQGDRADAPVAPPGTPTTPETEPGVNGVRGTGNSTTVVHGSGS